MTAPFHSAGQFDGCGVSNTAVTTAISSAVSAGAGGLSGKIALSDGAAVRVGKALRRSRRAETFLK